MMVAATHTESNGRTVSENNHDSRHSKSKFETETSRRQVKSVTV